MTKRICSWKGCKKEINLDISFEKTGIAKNMGITVSGWCPLHTKLYHKQCDMFESLVEQYNKKQLRNKFDRIIKFNHHSDVSNYLYQYDRKEYNRLVKQ